MMPKTQNGWKATKTGLSPLPQVSGSVLAGPVWVVFYWLAEQFAARVEPIRRDWSWGWSYRRISGSRKWSNHASGTAVDFNAPKHPAGKRGTFTAAQADQISLILKAARGVLRWGHLFSDEMHFEVAPGTARAAVEELAAMILQAALGNLGHNPGPIDGVVGPKTTAALRDFRTAAGVPDCHWTSPVLWAAITLARTERKLPL